MRLPSEAGTAGRETPARFEHTKHTASAPEIAHGGVTGAASERQKEASGGAVNRPPSPAKEQGLPAASPGKTRAPSLIFSETPAKSQRNLPDVFNC